jgi:uncharacterized membrane protein
MHGWGAAPFAVAHSAITRYLAGTNALIIRIKMLLLLVVSFLPFPTGFPAQYSAPDDAARVATTMYGLAIFAAWVLTAVMWRYALHAGLVDPDASGDELDALTMQITPGLADYLAMIALGLFLTTAAVFDAGTLSKHVATAAVSAGMKQRRRAST